MNPSRKSDIRVHYWIGANSTQDEQGTVVVKTIELDDLMGGVAVQYRERQGSESSVFLRYFEKTGLRYLKGGATTGFNHVTTEHDDALFRVTGNKTCRVQQVAIGWESMNDGDCFVLDLGSVGKFSK